MIKYNIESCVSNFRKKGLQSRPGFDYRVREAVLIGASFSQVRWEVNAVKRIILYHTGFEEIRKPDVHYGRKNADFGQGFYMSLDRSFSERWAKERKGSSTIVNTYELNMEGLLVKHFVRDEEWFDCIFSNRNGRPDPLSGYDVIVGPIANDTIYNVFGITTSGVLNREQAGELLRIGPEYTQVVIKTEKAAEQLTWKSSEVLDSERIAIMQATVQKEQEEYQVLFAKKMEELI